MNPISIKITDQFLLEIENGEKKLQKQCPCLLKEREKLKKKF